MRELGELPDEIAVSVVTAAELELGVLRAEDTDTRDARAGPRDLPAPAGRSRDRTT